MAYVDQNQSKEKTIAAVITAIILAAVGYAFVTGLAFNVIKKTAEKLNVIDIKTPPPPPPPKPSQASGAKPKGNPGDWVTSDDYPPSALRNNEAGSTGFRLDIGPDGRVTNCTVTSSSGSPDLDQTACRLLPRRGRFTPAKDAAGNGIATTYSSSVRWQIPKD
jgi:protein TonB